MKKTSLLSAVIGLALGLAAQAQSIINPELPGNLQTDGWSNLIGTNTGPENQWNVDKSFLANLPGSNAASKLQLTNDTGAYPATAGIYTGHAGEASTFSLTLGSVLNNAETVVFQVFQGYNANTISPLLSINGGTGIAADITKTLFDGNAGQGKRAVLLFQWDLRSQPEVTSLAFNFSADLHSQLIAFQVDQGDVYAEAVPEPSTWALIGMSAAGLVLLQSRRRRFAA